MPKSLPPKRWYLTDTALHVREEADLPPGVAGRVSGIALTYETVDTYDTMFARGSLKRSIDTKVAARKVPLLMDHERSTRAHVGVVTAMQDVGDALVMTADVFDTAEGRAALEYVKAVLASGASTGFSIGFVPRSSATVKMSDKLVERFTEIELREVSITPMPAVPGADVTNARAEDEQQGQPERSEVELLTVAARMALDALPADMRAAMLAGYANGSLVASLTASSVATDTPAEDATASVRDVVSLDARLRAVRQSLIV
jgi:HK97 family phage prohead protease